MNRLTEEISKDLQISTKRYEECCRQHHFLEAAAIQDLMNIQKKYLRLARLEELRKIATRQGYTVMDRYPSGTVKSILETAWIEELKKK